MQQGTIALYTDLFVLMALCAYLQASGRQQDLPLVEATFQAAAQNLCNDQFPDLFPQQYQPGRISHGKYMIALNAFVLPQCWAGTNVSHSLPTVSTVSSEFWLTRFAPLYTSFAPCREAGWIPRRATD